MKRTAILMLVLMVLIVAALGIGYIYRSNTGPRLLSRARLALRANKPQKAHELAAKYIRDNPDDWQGYYLQSRAFGIQSRFTEAREALEQSAINGAEMQFIAIAKGDLLIAEGQAALTSQEAADLSNAAERLAEALVVLAEAKPSDEEIAIDILYRIGMVHRAAAAANGRLAVVLQRRSLRIRASRRAAPLLEQWDQVFTEMGADRKARLMAILRDTLEFQGLVEAELGLLREAARIVAGVLDELPADAEFRQQAWIVAACLALLQADLEPQVQDTPRAEWLDLAEQSCREALAADAEDWQAIHLQSQVAYRRADTALVQARETMLDVISRDPSRSEAAVVAVRLCLTSSDREGLATARAALDPLVDDPLAASLLLIRHELLLADEQLPPGPAYRERIAQAAKTLDEIVQRHAGDSDVLLLAADIAVRRRQYEQAAERIQKVLGIDPRGSGAGYARLQQARIALATKGPEAVEVELTQLRADHPDAPEVQYTYALAMVALGKTDLATDAYQSLTKLGRGRPLLATVPGPETRLDSRTELNRAEVAIRLGDAVTAIEICDNLIVGADSPDAAFHARGWLLRSWAQWRARRENVQRLAGFVVQANNTDYADDAAAATDEVLALATDALRRAEAEPTGPDGPSAEASAPFAEAMRLLPMIYTCRSMMNDLAGAEEVIEILVAAPRLSAQHRASVAAMLGQLGQTEAAERTLRSELTQHPDGPAADLIYARLIEMYLNKGQISKALAELDAMVAAGGTASALVRKAAVLAAIGRQDEANAIVAPLVPEAIQAGDLAMLRQLTAYYSRTSQPDKTAEMLEHLGRLRPPVAADYIVGASALSSAGRHAAAAAMYRRAIGLERDEMAIPALYRDLAMLLDADQRRSEALAALAELRDLRGPDSRRLLNQAEALFHEGSLMLRWGLYGQAADRFRRLAAGEEKGSVSGRMALGRALAGLGEIDEATRVLLRIPPGHPEYLPSQLLRVSLIADTTAQLQLLERLARISPTHEGVLTQRMSLLRQVGRPAEAVEIYRRFAAQQGLAYRPTPPGTRRSESRAPILALYTLWEAGLRDDVAQEARRLAELTGAQAWHIRAALLTVDSDPQGSAAMLEASWQAVQAQSETPTQMGELVALSGVSVAALAGDADAAGMWLARVDSGEARADTEDRLLATLVAGSEEAVRQRLGDIDGVSGFGQAPATELVLAVAADGAIRAEAAKILAASVAAQVGMPWVTCTQVTDLLRARPQSQWAAALLHTYRIDDAQRRLVTELLQPADCTVQLIVQADLLAAEGKKAEAAELYRSVAEQTGMSNVRMQYALALEQSGRTEEAIAEYVAVWDSNHDPIAANNAAYQMQVLYGEDKDPAKLAEAHRLASEAVQAQPDQGAFRDTLGWIAYLRGHHERAAKELAQAVRTMPGSPTVHYHVGLAEGAAGRRQLAVWHLQTATLLVDRATEAGRPVSVEDRASAEHATAMLAQMDAAP